VDVAIDFACEQQAFGRCTTGFFWFRLLLT
jgi:hypothetical protein